MNDPKSPLRDVRAIGLLNNWEVFGHERGCIEWFKALRRQGATVSVGVTTMQAGGPLKELVSNQGFPTFDVPYGCQWSKAFFRREPWLLATNLLAISRCSRALRSNIRQLDATHVLLGNPLVFSFVAPTLWLNRSIKLIYRMGDEPPNNSKPNLWIWKRCFARADAVVANSEFVKNSIERCAGRSDKVKLIYNVAPIADQGISQVAELRAKRFPKRVLFVGQMSAHKGANLLVSAAIKICEADPEFRFDLVGSSLYTKSFEDSLKEQVNAANLTHRIVFHGHVGDPTEFYRRSSILVVPSVFEEPAANVVLEAKQLGLPAIVFPSGGLSELVAHEKTGIVCADKTEASLRAAIVKLCGDPERLENMELQCRTEYEMRFSEARFDQQWRGAIDTNA